MAADSAVVIGFLLSLLLIFIRRRFREFVFADTAVSKKLYIEISELREIFDGTREVFSAVLQLKIILFQICNFY